MKPKIKFLINPFERIAGWQALTIGIAVMALTAVVGKINHVAFDGALDSHPGTFSLSISFIMQVVAFISIFLSMWLAGVLFSKAKLRAIDIAGTMALARAPMLLFAVVCFLPIAPASLYDIPNLIISNIINIPLLIWMVALMYNAYSVSCHLKGSRAVISFIGAVIVAEILSKLILYLLLGSMSPYTSTISISEITKIANTVVVTDSLTIQQKTENVVKAFEQENLEAVPIYFDEQMKKGLPLSGLEVAWAQTKFTCGKFEKADMESMKESSIEKYDVIEVPFFFTKDKRNLRLVFNKDREISGLFFLSVN